MQSTMMDFPLTVGSILRHGRTVYSESQVVTCETNGSRRASFATVAERADRLAGALRRLGIRAGDRVGTFAWNTQEHLEAYLAIPSMGAVLHMLNIRLFPEQLEYVINHGEAKVILVEDSLVPLLAKVAPRLKTVRQFVVIGTGDASVLGNALRYEDLLAAEKPGFEWPELDERSAAAMCYTSGTTGNPKGVVYSHRSNYLHSIAVCLPANFGLREGDRFLPIVPLFHANAWGIPYAGWMAGCDFLMPGRFLQPEPLCAFIQVKDPILLMHGEADDNSGTFPIQSERFYMALKGHGATVRYITLPFEAHGYAGRETLLHVLAERLNWFDKYVKNAPPRTKQQTAENQ